MKKRRRRVRLENAFVYFPLNGKHINAFLIIHMRQLAYPAVEFSFNEPEIAILDVNIYEIPHMLRDDSPGNIISDFFQVKSLSYGGCFQNRIFLIQIIHFKTAFGFKFIYRHTWYVQLDTSGIAF